MITFESLTPMLLEEGLLDLSAPGWLYETKFDGYRLLVEIDGQVRLRTRHGIDATKWFPEIVAGLSWLRGKHYILDGEVCVLDAEGKGDFGRLQGRAEQRRLDAGADPVVYCAFDLLVDRNVDITRQTLVKRKTALAALLRKSHSSVLYVGHRTPAQVRRGFDNAITSLKLEGLVAKRKASIYQQGIRSSDWIKMGC
jgi:bifunctional non-homologous end joining protein LigD